MDEKEYNLVEELLFSKEYHFPATECSASSELQESHEAGPGVI